MSWKSDTELYTSVNLGGQGKEVYAHCVSTETYIHNLKELELTFVRTFNLIEEVIVLHYALVALETLWI